MTKYLLSSMRHLSDLLLVLLSDEFNTADMFCTSCAVGIRSVSHPFTQSLVNGAMIRVPVDSHRGFASGSNDAMRRIRGGILSFPKISLHSLDIYEMK